MRRTLRGLLMAALGLLIVTAASGLTLVRSHRLAFSEGAQGWAPATRSPLGLLHAVAGHATALAVAVAASMGLIIGLHGLLEPRGRRLPAGLLFVLAPALMALALGAEISARVDWDAGRLGAIPRALFDAYVARHGTRLATLLAAATVAGSVASWLARRGDEARDAP